MEIKCYTKDETLTKRKEVQDEKKLKSNIARLTNISQSPKDFTDHYYVDVCLPVPILKVNCLNINNKYISNIAFRIMVIQIIITLIWH